MALSDKAHGKILLLFTAVMLWVLLVNIRELSMGIQSLSRSSVTYGNIVPAARSLVPLALIPIMHWAFTIAASLSILARAAMIVVSIIKPAAGLSILKPLAAADTGLGVLRLAVILLAQLNIWFQNQIMVLAGTVTVLVLSAVFTLYFFISSGADVSFRKEKKSARPVIQTPLPYIGAITGVIVLELLLALAVYFFATLSALLYSLTALFFVVLLVFMLMRGRYREQIKVHDRKAVRKRYLEGLKTAGLITAAVFGVLVLFRAVSILILNY